MGMIQSLYAGRDTAADRRLREQEASRGAEMADLRMQAIKSDLAAQQKAAQSASQEQERQRRLNISTGLIRGIEIAKRTGNKAPLQGYWSQVQPYLQQQLGDKAQLTPEWNDAYETQVYKMHAALGGEIPQAQTQASSSDFLRAVQILEDPNASPQVKDAAQRFLGQKPRAVEMRPSPRIIQGVDEQGRPTFEVVDPMSGQVPTIKPTPKTTATQTSEAERKAAGFFERMKAAGEIVESLEASGYDPTNPRDLYMAGKGPLNIFSTDRGQNYRQAQENWIRANLRKESGAVIGEEEMNSEIKNYFPQLGDSPAVIAQKRNNRRILESNMQREAGRALAPQEAQQGKYSVGQVITVGGKSYKVVGGDMNDPDVEEVK